jgi:hypothetical protein
MAANMIQDETTELNYRWIALGLWGGKLPRLTAVAAATRSPPENDVTLLALEDLFAVIDLYRIQTSDNKRKR